MSDPNKRISSTRLDRAHAADIMSIMLLIALALQLSAAEPRGPLPFRPEDLPIEEVESGKALVVAYRATVRPDATIQDCKVEVRSGSDKLDALTCRLVLRRARFRAAQAADGSPSYGIFRSTAAWSVNPPASYIYPVDMQLKVTRLPAGERSPSTVRVIFSVDGHGNASSCKDDRTYNAKSNPALVQVACRELASKYRPIPALTDAGVSVPSVQNARVSFVQE